MEENKNEVIKEEVSPVGKKAVEEKKEETPVETVDNRFVEPVEIGNKEEVQSKINDARIEFKKIHGAVTKKNRITGIIFMALMVAVIGLAYAFPKYINFMFIAIIAAFIVVLVLTKFAKRDMDVSVGDYLSKYGTYSDSFVFKNDKIKDVKMGFREKPDENVVKSMRFVKNIYHVGSRDVVKGKMCDIDFEVADVSIKTGLAKVKKTQKTVFVGKMVSFNVDINDEGRVLMYRKGCGDSTPDDLDDVNEVNVPDLSSDWKVYSSNNNYQRIFTKDMVSALNQLKTDDILDDILVSFNKDKILIGLSYTDKLMIIPLENDFDAGALDHYRNDINTVCFLADAISKNRYLK